MIGFTASLLFMALGLSLQSRTHIMEISALFPTSFGNCLWIKGPGTL